MILTKTRLKKKMTKIRSFCENVDYIEIFDDLFLIFKLKSSLFCFFQNFDQNQDFSIFVY